MQPGRTVFGAEQDRERGISGSPEQIEDFGTWGKSNTGKSTLMSAFS